jgi:hypothetical protein
MRKLQPCVSVIHSCLLQLRLLRRLILDHSFPHHKLILLLIHFIPAFNEVLYFEVREVIPVFEPAQNIIQSNYAELLVV